MKILPESSFLIACCHEEQSQDGELLAERAAAVKSWDGAIESAASNGIALLALNTVQSLCERGVVPSSAVGRLKAIAIGETVRVFLLRNALKRILTELERKAIRIMVLKGASLSHLYGESWLRPSQDIDLLCREEDFHDVLETLVSLGYCTDDGSYLPERHSHNETHFERHFFSPDSLVHVELHVDSIKLGVRPKHADSIWTRARTISIDGASALSLCAEDQALMLSVHLHRHGFNRLIWFKDLDLLIRQSGERLDWGLVVAEAKAEGAESSLWYVMSFLRKMLDTPMPDSVLRELAPARLTRWMYGKVWPESDVLNLNGHTRRRAVQFSASESWRGMIPSLILMGRRREKLGILLKRILSP